MPSSKVLINSAKYSVRIGSTAKERQTPQPVELDAEIGLDVLQLPEGQTSALKDTVCWDRLQQLIASELSLEWVLVEDLAPSLCRKIFAEFEMASTVLLRIRKFPYGHIQSVGLEYLAKRVEMGS